MIQRMLVLLLLPTIILNFSFASHGRVTEGDQKNLRADSHRPSQVANLDPNNPPNQIESKTTLRAKLRWEQLDGKSQFNWLRSQEYRDANAVFANIKKYLDVDDILNNNDKKNILQQIINSKGQSVNRRKRSNHAHKINAFKKNRNKHKKRKTKHHSKAAFGSKRNSTRSHSHGEPFSASQTSHKQNSQDLDLRKMDNLIMAMTLDRFTANKEEEKGSEYDNRKIEPAKDYDHKMPMALENNGSIMSMKFDESNNVTAERGDTLENQDIIDYTKTNLGKFEASNNLLPLTSGNYRTDFTPEDDINGGVWLDIPSTHNNLLSHPKGNRLSRVQRSVTSRERTKDDFVSFDGRTKVKSSRDKNLSYLQKILLKFERILSNQMSKKLSKNDKKYTSNNEAELEQGTTKMQNGDVTKREVKNEVTTREGNGARGFELGFVSLNGPTRSDVTSHKDLKEASNRETNETHPVLIQTKDERIEKPNVKNAQKQKNGNVKQTEQELKISKAEYKELDQEKPEKSSSSRPRLSKGSNLFTEFSAAMGVNSNSDNINKECERIHTILPVLKELWSFATKPIDNVFSNRIRNNIFQSAMVEISKLMDEDTLNEIENGLMKCASPQYQSILPVVTKIRSLLTRQAAHPISELDGVDTNQAISPDLFYNRKIALPVLDPRELSRFSTLQNIVNHNLVGPKSHEIFRDKFESMSPFSHQRDTDADYYLAGPYCLRVFKYYFSTLDEYNTQETPYLYQRQSDSNRCVQVCQFAAKFIAYGASLGIVENICMRRLMKKVNSCQCDQLLPDGNQEMNTETDEQEEEPELYSDDPRTHPDTKMATSMDMMFGRGKPMRPEKHYVDYLNARPYPDDKLVSNEPRNYIPRFVNNPIILPRNRIPHTINNAGLPMEPFGHFLSQQKAKSNVYFRQNTMQLQPGSVKHVENSSINPVIKLAAPQRNRNPSPRPLPAYSMPERGPVYSMMPVFINPRNSQMPRHVPIASSGESEKDSDSTFQFYNPLVILVTAPRK